MNCASLNLLGKKMVYLVLIPDEAMLTMGVIRPKADVIQLLLILLIILTAIPTVSFVFLMVSTACRDMQLSSTLIKQMEVTQSAESKCMNKSTAFVQASHDIRASLAGIMGLIDLSYDDIGRHSDLRKNLNQMKKCAQDLLALLNSILDASKIEAGKMLLEEEEFNIAELIEDVVNLFYPVAKKKGVDLILDPHDGSVLKSSLVRGDRGKLKQIISNLLSNAVKFTSVGHIVVRAWTGKLSLDNTILPTPPRMRKKILSCLHYCRHEEGTDVLLSTESQDIRNCVEFFCEVSDTGSGITKEKRKSVFENYIQVEETNEGQGGTGLGRGIVRSLAKLMGGDIEIIDKEIREKGTCFRFNVLLAVPEPVVEQELETVDKEAEQSFSHWQVGSILRSLTRALSIRSQSPRRTSSPNSEGSQVILLMQKDERCSVTQRFMRRLGIEVFVVNQMEDLDLVSRKMQPRLKTSFSSHSLSGFSEISSKSGSLRRSGSNKCFPVGGNDSPLRLVEGTNHIVAVQMQTSRKHRTGLVLIVVDATMGPFPELHRVVNEFRDGIPRSSKVIWLDKPLSRTVDRRLFAEGSGDPINLVLSKPLHGSYLFEVIKLLPEFAGPMDRRPFMIAAESPAERASQMTSQEIKVVNDANPLSGKKVLVADDSAINRRIAEKYLKKLGASVELCKDGTDALELVRDGLLERMNSHPSAMLPYDYILMDCQMPGMDGYEATTRIREEEKGYGVHIPIIALTAHDSGPEARRIFEVGMDYHLKQPLSEDRLLEAIASLRCG
ncbi:hypothetical protein MLD38_028158 [Melastoma candidum]|uniref:Uncharacterized protein n=1 Tax=Melastoma candidum TaxID=119954 RepID=A0ACB9N2D3_9MYRT|nr:hypothetical protein MLD38_028158 [Melastoma candidum]